MPILRQISSAVLFAVAAYILGQCLLDNPTNTQMLTRLAARSAPRFLRTSTTTVPSYRAMSSFVLDKDIFKPALYKQLQHVWFDGIELGAKDVNMDAAKRWFMASAEEKVAFDGVCREKFGHALEAIGPEKFPAASAEPFLREITEAAKADGAEGAWTALSLVLLLDQISRHIFRTNDGLVKVYNHYDKMSYALMRSLLSADSPIGRPDLHPQWRLSTVFRLWFYLPLVHSEEIEAHNLYDEIMASFGKELEQEGASESMRMFWSKGLEAEKEHRDILDKFGRYPHRNEALGRTATQEEKEFMEAGGATFGVAQEKKA